MNQQELNNSQNKKNFINVNLDEFDISEDSFKPVTKGLGFHHEQKRANAFKSTPKEVKSFATTPKIPSHQLLNEISNKNKSTVNNAIPTGLEAFYNSKNDSQQMQSISAVKNEEIEKELNEIKKFKLATTSSQFFAWAIDVALIVAFASVTTILLVLVSGMSFDKFIQVVPQNDLIIFGSVLFSIYYLLYFTILDLSATPGKTILGIRLVKSNEKQVSVKNTFMRSFVSLLSFVALFLPMVIDFQGKLSDTKVVK